MKVRAIRTYLSRNNDEPVDVEVELELMLGVRGDLVLALTSGNVTGFESFRVMDIDWDFLWEGETMCLCAGTKGSWDKLEIPVTEIYRFVRDRGLMHLGVEVPESVKERHLREVKGRLRMKMGGRKEMEESLLRNADRIEGEE